MQSARCVFNKVVTGLDEKLTLLGVESEAMVATNINPKLAGYNLLYLYLVFKLDNTTTVYMLAQSLFQVGYSLMQPLKPITM